MKLSLLLCFISSLALMVQASTPEQTRIIESRAVEAVIRGMPAVNYDLMLQEMLSKTPDKVNQVIYWGRPLDAQNQTLTPNPDALYFIAFFNTKEGPIVLDLPSGDASGSFNGNIVTVWQMPLEDAGLLGLDKGAGGKCLVLPPGYTNTVPEGYIPLQSDTFGGYMLFRANLKSHSKADVDASIAYGKRMKVYPLAQADNPPATVFSDVRDIDFDSTVKYDASFFEHLNRIVQTEPWIDRDRIMIDQLRSIGIEKSEPFAPDDATGATLDGGKTYKLTVPQPVPGKLFWSVTVYDTDTRSQVNTDQGKAALRSLFELKGKVGTAPLDLYFGPTTPVGHEGEWIKTIPGKGWFVYFRIYGPEQPAFDGSWKPGDFEEVK